MCFEWRHPVPADAQIVLMNKSAGIRRNIEQKGGIAANRAVINMRQFFQRSDFIVFGRMVEPAGTDRGIDFGRIPYQLLLALNDAPVAEILFARFIAARKLPVIGLRDFSWIASF